MSYAYGAAVAAMGFLVVRAAPTPTSAAHAAALFVHGLRLNAFLLWREVHVERFRSNRESVEASARASGGRLQRAPFILCCSALYACMSAPIILSARAQAAGRLTASLVAIAWAGLVLGAIGDVTKSWVKARRGPDTLVVSGVYRLFRHPNYTGTQTAGSHPSHGGYQTRSETHLDPNTGEQVLWTSSMLAGVAATAAGGVASLRASSGLLLGSLLGWAAICFVLARATAELERKHAARYDTFTRWRASSWGGVGLRRRLSDR